MHLTIKPIPPFNFDLSAKIFSNGDKQIHRYEDGRYWRVIRVKDNLVLIILKSSGSTDSPKLSVELESNQPISGEDSKIAEEAAISLFNLDLDLKTFYKEIKNDNILTAIVEKLRGLKSPATPTVFEALVSSIIEQQIALNVALDIERKMVKTFGDALKIGDNIYYAFPTPQKLASATIEEIRRCGLSQRKTEYLLDISRSIAEGRLDLEKYKNYEDTKEIIRELDEVRGIGVWTAELTMLRGMHKLEAMPAEDLGLRRCISHYYRNDRKITSREARSIAEKWGSWKGLAGFYLIMAERSGIKV